MKKSGLIAIAATVILVVIALILSFGLRKGIRVLTGQEQMENPATPESSVTTGFFDTKKEDNTIYLPTGDGETDAYQPGVFVELDTGEDTNVGKFGYMTSRVLPEFAEPGIDVTEYKLVTQYYKEYQDSMNLVPAHDAAGNVQTLYTGHTIYTQYDISTSETANPDNTKTWRYIKNGFDVLELNAYDTIPEDEGYLLRKEDSNERIRLFDTQEELDAANAAWGKGQAILNGEEEEVQGGIILDGCYLPGVSWEVSSLYGEPDIYVSLADIGAAFTDGSYITTSGVLHIPISEGCGNFSVEIPSKKSVNFENEVTAFGINKEFNTWNIRASLWEDTLPLTTESFFMPATLASRITGWRFYFDGVMLNIVTEECNVNNNFILRQ